MSGIFVVAAKRTPFGSFGGSLKAMTATQLGVVSTKAALVGIDPALIDHVIFGNVIGSSKDAAYLARHIGLQSEIPITTPALTLNRLCGSGFETVAQGANLIRLGEAQMVVCGGTENMSMAPLQANGLQARWGISLGTGLNLEDALWSGLTDAHSNTPMGVTAENLAKQFAITREECDEYAIRSQTLWAAAHQAGVFQAEMAPIEIVTKKGGVSIMDTDEHPRPDSTLDSISKLRPVFAKDGVVTAANASGISDGAGTIVLASETAVSQHNLTPLARLVSTAVTGCEPTIMGISPVEAIRKVLAKADWTIQDLDRVEINEAFAAQYLACEKALELDRSKTNCHGGAISLGHPLGASGSRITAHLAHEFATGNGNRYVGAACIGGGQGIAVALERP
jgi:acetyl-CoA acyltransferase 2